MIAAASNIIGTARNHRAPRACGEWMPSRMGPSVSRCHRLASYTNAMAPPRTGRTAQAPDERSGSPSSAAELETGTTVHATGCHTPRMCAPLHTPGKRIAVEDGDICPIVPGPSRGSGGAWRRRSPAVRQQTRQHALRAGAEGDRTLPQRESHPRCRRERPEANTR